MKQTRRGFLGRVVAIAAAGAVSPSAKADAAPPENLRIVRPAPEWPDRSHAGHVGCPVGVRVQTHPEFMTVTYCNGVTVDKAYDLPPLTFEAMVADCRARGCYLTQEGPTLWRHLRIDPKTFDGEVCHHEGSTYEGIDAWRRSLHDQADEMPERTPFGGWVYRTPDPNGHSIAVKFGDETRYIRYWI